MRLAEAPRDDEHASHPWTHPSQSKGRHPRPRVCARQTDRDLKALRERHLEANHTEGWDYGLAGPATAHSVGKLVWFGAVSTNKMYVSYYLMPVRAFPDLLEGISPQLRKRMQGKSCWNLESVDEELFAELGALTTRAHQRYVDEGWILPAGA